MPLGVAPVAGNIVKGNAGDIGLDVEGALAAGRLALPGEVIEISLEDYVAVVAAPAHETGLEPVAHVLGNDKRHEQPDVLCASPMRLAGNVNSACASCVCPRALRDQVRRRRVHDDVLETHLEWAAGLRTPPHNAGKGVELEPGMLEDTGKCERRRSAVDFNEP